MQKLSETVIEELTAMTVEQLEKTIADCHAVIEQATAERNDNPKYQTAKEVLKDFNQGLKGVRDVQKAKIAYALSRRKELEESNVTK
jgi:tRNA (Thr-GGU) A37 N-methylase